MTVAKCCDSNAVMKPVIKLTR